MHAAAPNYSRLSFRGGERACNLDFKNCGTTTKISPCTDFAIVTIFKLKLMLVVGEYLSVGPLNERSRRPGRAGGEKKTKLSSGSAGAALARAVADDGWMSAVARSTERGTPLHVMGAATLSNGCRDYCVVAAKDLLCSGLRYAMKD
ncbi:MAG TPA: hypothetical protein VKG24_03800 [Pseudolabrys sp.]|nr:hypothetical protein [Pseudolabrys sp.]